MPLGVGIVITMVHAENGGFWRGAWYYRDEAGGRWIFWNR